MSQPPSPLISIVTPVFNGERFLARAIASVRQQTFPHWEHLLADDASADGSWAALTAYASAEPRVRLLRHPDNRGQSAARNLALRAACGEWVVYLDQDDEFYPDYLQRVADHAHRGDVLVFAYDLQEERPGHPQVGSLRTWEPRRVYDQLMNRHIAVPLGVAHRRALLERAGLFDESLPIDEDADLWRRFARAGAAFVYLDERSGLYHVRADSASRLIRAGYDPRAGAGFSSPVCTVEVRAGEERHLLKASRDETGVVEQVFARHEYGGVPAKVLRDPPTILDVGANVGAFAVYAKLVYHRQAVVHCFEPFPPCVELLRQNVASFPGVQVHALALSDHDGEAPLFLHQTLSVCHSLVRGLFDAQVGELAVPVRDAGRFWDELGLQEVDILKLDAEGSEVRVLESLGPRLNAVRCVLTEYHSRRDRRHLDALLSGFELFGAVIHSVDVGVVKYVRADLLGPMRAETPKSLSQ